MWRSPAEEGAKTFIIDTPMVLGGGALIGMMASREAKLGLPALLGAFWGVAFTGAVTVMAMKHPDWMLGYVDTPEHLPIERIHVAFLLVNALCGAAGACAANSLWRSHGPGYALMVVLAGASLWIFLWVLTFDGYTSIGTTAEYRTGRALPIAADAAMQADMALNGPLDALAFLLPLGFAFWRRRKLAKAA
jgi:hypothetical protein